MRQYILFLTFFLVCALSTNNLTGQERRNNITNATFAQNDLRINIDTLRPEQKIRLDIAKFFGRTRLTFFGAVTARYSPDGIPSLMATSNPITLAETQWGFTAELGRVLASLHLGRFGWELSAPQNPNEKLSNRSYTNDASFGYIVWEHQGFSLAPCVLSGETWRSLEHDPLKITYLNSLGGEVNLSYTFPLHHLNIAGESIPDIADMIDAMIAVRIGYAQHFTSDNSGRLFAPFAIPTHQEFSARLVLGIGFSTLFLGSR